MYMGTNDHLCKISVDIQAFRCPWYSTGSTSFCSPLKNLGHLAFANELKWQFDGSCCISANIDCNFLFVFPPTIG